MSGVGDGGHGPYSVPGQHVRGVTGVPAGAPLATWGQRAVALIIEVCLLILLLLPVALLSSISDFLGTVGGIAWLAAFLYWQFQNGSCGQSPGKAITGLKVVHADTGQVIGGGMGILRYLIACLLSVFTCGLGQLLDYLFPLWDARRQTIHDKALKSVVLANQPRRQLADLWRP